MSSSRFFTRAYEPAPVGHDGATSSGRGRSSSSGVVTVADDSCAAVEGNSRSVLVERTKDGYGKQQTEETTRS